MRQVAAVQFQIELGQISKYGKARISRAADSLSPKMKSTSQVPTRWQISLDDSISRSAIKIEFASSSDCSDCYHN
jgi:hypothetical protein